MTIQRVTSALCLPQQRPWARDPEARYQEGLGLIQTYSREGGRDTVSLSSVFLTVSVLPSPLFSAAHFILLFQTGFLHCTFSAHPSPTCQAKIQINQVVKTQTPAPAGHELSAQTSATTSSCLYIFKVNSQERNPLSSYLTADRRTLSRCPSAQSRQPVGSTRPGAPWAPNRGRFSRQVSKRSPSTASGKKATGLCLQ